MQDIHPNMPPISLPWFTIIDWVILACFVAVVLGAGWYVWSKKSKTRPAGKTKPEKIKRFYRKDALKVLRKFIENEDWKGFSVAVSDEFKRLLSYRYKTNFTEKTTEEILSYFSHKNTDKRPDIGTFFAQLDPIKYAGKQGQKAWAEKVFSTFKSFYTRYTKH